MTMFQSVLSFLSLSLSLCLFGGVHVSMSTTTLETIYSLSDGWMGGIFLQYIDPGLYIYGDGFYIAAFFTTGDGVILIDYPPNFYGRITSIVNNVTNEQIKYMVYTHHHLDHIGGAAEFDTDTYDDHNITIICHEDAYEKIKQRGGVPLCHVTIDTGDKSDNSSSTDNSDSDDSIISKSISKISKTLTATLTGAAMISSTNNNKIGAFAAGTIGFLMINNFDILYANSDNDNDDDDDSLQDFLDIVSYNGTFNLGTQNIQLDYWGAVHSDGNLFVYSSQHKFLMVVDLVFPGWTPFRYLGMIYKFKCIYIICGFVLFCFVMNQTVHAFLYQLIFQFCLSLLFSCLYKFSNFDCTQIIGSYNFQTVKNIFNLLCTLI